MPEKLQKIEKSGALARNRVESYLLRVVSEMKPGEKFYSVREVSRFTGVNRGVVAHIMSELKEREILDSYPYRGYFVKESYLVNEPPPPYRESEASFFFSVPATAPAAKYEPGYERFINLGCSCPDPNVSNADKYLSSYQTSLAGFKNKFASLQRTFPATVHRILIRRGMFVPVKNFCVLRNNALAEVAARVVRRGDHVVMADWGDTEAEHAFLTAGAEVLYTGSDANGMVVENISRIHHARKVHAVFIRPACGIPACRHTCNERLDRLLLWAEEMNFVVISVEAEQDLNPDVISPPLLDRDGFNRSICISCLCCAFPEYYKVDIVIGPSDFIKAFRQSPQVQLSQLEPLRALALVLLEKKGVLQSETRRLRNYYGLCFNSLHDLFKRYLGDRAALMYSPGSLNVYIRFAETADLSVLAEWLKENCLYNARCNAHLEGSLTVNAIRLNYGFPGIKAYKQLFMKLSELINI